MLKFPFRPKYYNIVFERQYKSTEKLQSCLDTWMTVHKSLVNDFD